MAENPTLDEIETLIEPVDSRWTAGRVLRSLTGANEAILRQIPTELTRYTAMGGLVLGTALTAMFSMSVALYSIFGSFQALAFLFVPVWGMFILFLDRWLMASTGVASAARRFWRLLPRFILAIMFGAIIAEPLLLGIFHTAIERQVTDDRQSAVERHEAQLKTCNPDPGTPAATSDVQKSAQCKGLVLNVDSGSSAKQDELTQTQSDAANLKVTIDADAAQYSILTEAAQKECVGDKGPGLTGHPGWGPNCRKRQAVAAQYRTDHRIDQNDAQYAADQAKIAKLSADLGTARGTEAADIKNAIAADVAKFKANQDTTIGLLERLRGLSELVRGGGYVLAAEWALRIFFITVDSLPVLSKFLSGYSTYDRIAADELSNQERAQRVANETARRESVKRQETHRYRVNIEHAMARKKVEFDARMRYIDVDIMHEDLVNRRAAYLLDDAPTIALTPFRVQDETEDSR